MAHKITMNKNLAYTESLQQYKIHLLLLVFKINKKFNNTSYQSFDVLVHSYY